jgi:hypothetical protein
VRNRREDPPEEFNTLPPLKRELLLRWVDLVLYPTKTVWKDATSYGLKHAAEDDLGVYISNGELKGAMVAAGFKASDPRDQNWHFYARPRQRYTGEFGAQRCKLAEKDRASLRSLIEMVRLSERLPSSDQRRGCG